MKWLKRLLFIAVMLIIPGGFIVLSVLAFMWAVRTGDELAAYSRTSYAEFTYAAAAVPCSEAIRLVV